MGDRSIFTVEEPATSIVLLTTAEAKAALGITDSSRDTDIDRLVGYISAAITNYCNWRRDGVNPRTLLSEEVRDVFRLQCSVPDGKLKLSRRFVSEITLLSEGGVELVEYDALTGEGSFVIDRASGIIQRLGASNEFGEWPQGVIVVDYTAGFAEVPPDLKLATEMWLRQLWARDYKTPDTITTSPLKVEDIPGVRRVEYATSTTTVTSADLPVEVSTILDAGGYVDKWLA